MSSPAQPLIITIDGPAGTGKSSVAHLLALRLGLEFLDTGAMYRAAALLAIEESIPIDEGESIAAALASTTLAFDWKSSPPRLLLGRRDVSALIRSSEVTEAVSPVSACAEVRREMVRRQREIAAAHPRLVTEGRDQGSEVFPDAPLHIYLEADARVRAQRRAAQLKSSGQAADEAGILRAIQHRDHVDSTRAVGPLRIPTGAVRVDTSHLDLEAVVSKLEQLARERLGSRLAAAASAPAHH
ncbi:MAG: (d)CMP kinase [Planctomycetes bacterium]|nr:(d)CMP kinase [Planctomycetota bacterium]